MRRWVTVVLCLLAVLAAVAVGPAGPIAAQTVSTMAEDPDQLARDVDAAQARLEQLENEESAAVEAANAAQSDLGRAAAAAADASRRADAAGTEVAVAVDGVRSRAVAAYKGGGAASEVALLFDSATPLELLDRIRYLRGMGDRDRARLERVAVARQQSADAEAESRQAVERQITLAARRDAEKAKAARAVASGKVLVANLDSRHRAALAAAEERRRQEEAAAAARAKAEAEARARQLAAAAAAAQSDPVPTVKVSQEGLQRAIDTALAQIGTPYVWGGEVPGAFDCSGLVRYAFLAGGVNVPHRADYQWFAGSVHPARDQLQPGDLVFFSTDNTPDGIHHVGIYVGGGEMVVAPHTGAFVRVESIDHSDYFGATRLIA